MLFIIKQDSWPGQTQFTVQPEVGSGLAYCKGPQ